LNVAINLSHGDVNEAQLALARLDRNGNVITSTITNIFTGDLADGYVQCSNPIQQGFDIIFDDEGCELPHEVCTDSDPSIVGQFKPFEALSSFDGGLLNAVAGDDFAILYRDIAGPGGANTSNGFGT